MKIISFLKGKKVKIAGEEKAEKEFFYNSMIRIGKEVLYEYPKNCLLRTMPDFNGNFRFSSSPG